MAGMTDRGRDLLPPEDATSWDEFQERYAIERGRYQVTGRSWKDTGRIVVSVIPGLAVPSRHDPPSCWIIRSTCPGCRRSTPTTR